MVTFLEISITVTKLCNRFVIIMSEFSGKMSIQEKIRSGLIKTPIKKLNKYFNYSYIFAPPTPKELAEMQSKVEKALKSKAK